MATDTLPEEGELRLGAVMLPPGRRIVPQEGPGEPVAWVTTQPVPDPGRVWSALSDAHLETGLVPGRADRRREGRELLLLRPGRPRRA